MSTKKGTISKEMNHLPVPAFFKGHSLVIRGSRTWNFLVAPTSKCQKAVLFIVVEGK